MGNIISKDKKQKCQTVNLPLQDCVGAISTVLSITAGMINLMMMEEGDADEWSQAWMTELGWSGIIETSAIIAVFITDSDVLRAIGGFSMLGVNSTSLYMINRAEEAEDKDHWQLTYTLHAIALGQAIGVWIGTFLVDGDGEFRAFDFSNE